MKMVAPREDLITPQTIKSDCPLKFMTFVTVVHRVHANQIGRSSSTTQDQSVDNIIIQCYDGEDAILVVLSVVISRYVGVREAGINFREDPLE